MLLRRQVRRRGVCFVLGEQAVTVQLVLHALSLADTGVPIVDLYNTNKRTKNITATHLLPGVPSDEGPLTNDLTRSLDASCSGLYLTLLMLSRTLLGVSPPRLPSEFSSMSRLPSVSTCASPSRSS